MSADFKFFFVLGGVVYLWCCLIAYVELTRVSNSVLRLAFTIGWPLRLGVFIAISIHHGLRRLLIDARELIPRRHAIQPPPRVTVEMLATEQESQHRAGQWMIP